MKGLKTQLCFSALLFPLLLSANSSAHYNEIGFFDIHVCNWPDQQLFLLTLFSTYEYKNVKTIEILDDRKRKFAELNLNKFRVIETEKGKKLAFLNHLKIPAGAGDGWYHATVTMKDGQTYQARDYVILDTLPQANGFQPGDDADITLPGKFRWNAVQGAKYYQVFIRDFWDDEKIIFSSELLKEPALEIPEGILEPGGSYGWRVHARDTNEHVLLGDFNHGSLSREIRFSTAE